MHRQTCTLKIRSEFPNIILVVNDANYGFAKANNIGLALTRGQYVVYKFGRECSAECLRRDVSVHGREHAVGMLAPVGRSIRNGGSSICDFQQSGLPLPFARHRFLFGIEQCSATDDERFLKIMLRRNRGVERLVPNVTT